MKKLYVLSFVLISVLAATAQSPTLVFTSSDCNFIRNFDSNDEGFSSPSIYADDENTSFFWTSSVGALVETSGLTTRDGSVISPVFLNTLGGQTVVGFTYNVPPNTDYRIRVIAGTIAGQLEIVATTANGPVWTPLPSTSGNICLLLQDADIMVGTAIRYEISFRGREAGDMLFDNFAINSANAPLPVTFLGFVAKKTTAGTTKLLWNVGEEVNVLKYVIERSDDGAHFTAIGSVPATGADNYFLDDAEMVPDTRYYRVKNVDIDGASKYTPVIKVSGNKNSSSTIQLYPVPANDILYVQHSRAPAKVNITVLGLDGRLMKQVAGIPNTYQTSVNISELKPGMYLLRYDDGSGIVQSAKMIKR